MSSPTLRAEGSAFQSRLTLYVATAIPPQVRDWPPTEAIVLPAYARFAVALSALDASPSPRTFVEALGAFHHVMESWSRATVRFRRRSAA